MADGRAHNPTGTLADHLAELDVARFVGRRAILERFDRLLAGAEPARVVLLHGPGGIGKSALLRALHRRAGRAGRPSWTVDARAMDTAPDELHSALRDALGRPGAVVLIDSFERLGAYDRLLRDRLLGNLAGDALTVVAGRSAPRPGWFRDGWEHVVAEIRLGPLSDDEAVELLAARAITRPGTVARLVRWAAGSPLALSLAAGAAQRGPAPDTDQRTPEPFSDEPSDGNPADALGEVDLNHLIVRRLGGDQLGQVDHEVLEVASVARAIDARLLAAVLPGRPTRAANEALRRCDVAELVGGRVTLHDLVRNALRDDLRRRQPQRYGRIRCAIADHLLAQARDTGQARLLADMIELIDDRDVRWGIGGDAMLQVHVDTWSDHDTRELVDAYVEEVGPEHWKALEALLAHAPEAALVARDSDDRAIGFCVATVAAQTAAVSEHDTLTARLLADARRGDARRALIFREAFQLIGSSAAAGSMTLGALTLAAVLRSGLANVERSYILVTQPSDDAGAFMHAVGATPRPDLDGSIAGRPVHCWLIDHGPGGMLGQVRGFVYAEAGMDLPDGHRQSEEQLRVAALDAVRQFARTDALTDNSLAALGPGHSDAEQVSWLREVITTALDDVFDISPQDHLLRRVVELGDIDPGTNHTQAMARLSLSRATYFRHLRRARERLARAIAGKFAGVL